MYPKNYLLHTVLNDSSNFNRKVSSFFKALVSTLCIYLESYYCNCHLRAKSPILSWTAELKGVCFIFSRACRAAGKSPA